MTSSLLNIGSRALAAAQGSLTTISHNIANANTAGYSRQQAMLETSGGDYTGGGFFGRGVDLTTVQRQYDRFLNAAVQTTGALSAADSARARGLQALDTLFAGGELGLGAGIDALFSATGDLANRPADLSARQVVIARSGQLAERISGIGGQLAALAAEADGRLKQDAAQVNTRLAEIAKLNAEIVHGQGAGHAPNDLLDQRDAAVQALGGLLSLQVVAQDDGSLNLFTADGAALLVGQQQATLAAVPDPADASRVALRLTVGGASQLLDRSGLGGGSLAGTLALRDEDIATAMNQVGRIAQVLASAFNSQQAVGVDMDGKPGAALFTVPGPATRPAATNTGSGSLAASIVDAGALKASDYEVRFDGAAYQITRLADGQTQSAPALPAVFDGLQFSAGGAPAAGDRWQVRPFAAAATDIAARPLNPRQLATGYAASVQAAAGNKGGATVKDFQVVRGSPDTAVPVTISFNDPPTSFNITGLTTGDLANLPYVPGQRVPAAPADHHGWSLTLAGTPVAGDSFQIGPNSSPGADNRNALALAGLARQGLADGATLNEAYASLLGDVGSRVQWGEAAADISARLQDEAVARQQNVAGVNLDEEAANLLRFQQAYQASARIIQASQSLFESLLSATGR